MKLYIITESVSLPVCLLYVPGEVLTACPIIVCAEKKAVIVGLITAYTEGRS